MQKFGRIIALALAFTLLLPLFFVPTASAEGDVTPMLAAGNYHALELDESGVVRAWGSNRYGQVGDGGAVDRSLPVQVMSGVKQIAAGSWASYALTSDGDLYAWGAGEQGQLGLGDTRLRTRPTKVMSGVVRIASALNRAYALSQDGTVYAWGNASFVYPDGQRLGRSPRAVATGVDAVFCGGGTTLFLRAGDLYAMGAAAKGSLSGGKASEVKIASDVVDAAATTSEIIFVDGGGRLRRYVNGSTRILLSSVRSVTAGGGKYAAVSTSGALYTWGSNAYGELGLGHRESVSSPSVALHTTDCVALGGDFIAARKINGELWTSGSNRMYQLADGGNRLDYNALHCVRGGDRRLGELSYGEYRVLLDGVRLSFDVPPVNRSGRLLVPMRAIFEALDAQVDWNGPSNTATAVKNGRTVAVTIGSSVAYVNGEAVELDAPAEKIDWRTLVPLRFVATALGAEVDYFGSERLCEIRSAGAPASPDADAMAHQSAVISVELEWGAQGVASGVVVHPNGLILTNRHVAEHAVSITAEVDGRSYPASVVHISPEMDFAILSIPATGLYAAKLSPAAAAVGAALTVYDGSTRSASSCTVTLRGYGGHSLLVDASLSPGVSGSGVYDARGDLAGLVWASVGQDRAAVLPATAFRSAIADAAAGY